MIDKLDCFLTLARVQHFARAAAECGVTQPTLSAAIKSLEEELGVLLVVRGSRFQGLTPEGQRVLEWARRIVGDARTLKEEMRAARRGLAGHMQIAVIPTALSAAPRLTTPFRARHPEVTFSILSRTSVQILSLIENHEIDAGITYLDNEPMGRVATVPLYRERYRLVANRDQIGGRASIGWADAAKFALCLLTPDMQNRRIIDRHLLEAGTRVTPTLESNSMIVLYAHVKTGQWASIMPADLVDTLGLSEPLAAVPIVEPDTSHVIGLVAPFREPHTPLVSALLYEARAASQMGNSD